MLFQVGREYSVKDWLKRARGSSRDVVEIDRTKEARFANNSMVKGLVDSREENECLEL
jgi:hypothetical protein